MAVHQGGKGCLLSQFDADELLYFGVEPKCSEHWYCPKADAELLCRDGQLRRLRVPEKVSRFTSCRDYKNRQNQVA